jgi:hypothetical protein
MVQPQGATGLGGELAALARGLIRGAALVVTNSEGANRVGNIEGREPGQCLRVIAHRP